MFDDAKYERWANQKEWAQEGHDYICNCASCHKEHILVDNYGNSDYKCCEDEILYKIQKNLWCSEKPIQHGPTYMGAGKCFECERESKQRKAV